MVIPSDFYWAIDFLQFENKGIGPNIVINMILTYNGAGDWEF